MRISRLPEVDRTNGWSASLAQRQAKPALQGERTADWVVLGAGYAGLAAARRLAENYPDNHIVLIEPAQQGKMPRAAIPDLPSTCPTMWDLRSTNWKDPTASCASRARQSTA